MGWRGTGRTPVQSEISVVRGLPSTHQQLQRREKRWTRFCDEHMALLTSSRAAICSHVVSPPSTHNSEKMSVKVKSPGICELAIHASNCEKVKVHKLQSQRVKLAGQPCLWWRRAREHCVSSCQASAWQPERRGPRETPGVGGEYLERRSSPEESVSPRFSPRLPTE